MDASSTELFRYQYDANNRLTNRWSNAKNGITTVYAYDALGNMTNIVYPTSPSISLRKTVGSNLNI